MADPRMIPNIIILTILGLVTSAILKLMNSIWKAMMTAVELFLSTFASAAVFGYPVFLGDFAALFVTITGVVLYGAASHTQPVRLPEIAPIDDEETAVKPSTVGLAI